MKYILPIMLFLTACTAPTVTTKTISVTKDEHSVVIQTTETESVQQQMGPQLIIPLTHFPNIK